METYGIAHELERESIRYVTHSDDLDLAAACEGQLRAEGKRVDSAVYYDVDVRQGLLITTRKRSEEHGQTNAVVLRNLFPESLDNEVHRPSLAPRWHRPLPRDGPHRLRLARFNEA